MIEITSKMAETVDKAEMTGTEGQRDAKIAQADAREAGQHAAEIRREERRANVEIGEPSSVCDLESIEAVEKAVQRAVAEARQEEKRARRQVDFYANKLADDRLWLITEFLSSMTVTQFAVLDYVDKIALCRIAASWSDKEIFADYFPDQALMRFRDANGKPLRGGRRIGYWKAKMPALGSDLAVLQRMKDFLRVKTLPACERKLRGMLQGAAMKKLCSKDLELRNEVIHLREFWARYDVVREDVRYWLEQDKKAEVGAEG